MFSDALDLCQERYRHLYACRMRLYEHVSPSVIAVGSHTHSIQHKSKSAPATSAPSLPPHTIFTRDEDAEIEEEDAALEAVMAATPMTPEVDSTAASVEPVRLHLPDSVFTASREETETAVQSSAHESVLETVVAELPACLIPPPTLPLTKDKEKQLEDYAMHGDEESALIEKFIG
jgi:hypothetical protein